MAIVIVMIAVLSVAKELYLASAYGKIAGLTFFEVINLWQNFSLTSNYSGAQVAALIRFERALYSFPVAILFIVIFALLRIYQGREKRAVDTLKACGQWNSD